MFSHLHEARLPGRVHHGCTVAAALGQALQRIPRADRVLLLTSGSNSRSPAGALVVHLLGERHAATFSGIEAHVPFPCVERAIQVMRDVDAQAIVALGGGSVMDAAKIVALMAGCRAATVQDLSMVEWRTPVEQAPLPAIVGIPTTFSAAEYTDFGGATDPETRMKVAFQSAAMRFHSVLNDPALLAATPMPLLLATGMKAIDHAVERVTSAAANAFSNALSTQAMHLLSAGLRGISRGEGVRAISMAQYGVFMAMCGMDAGVRTNVSHAIAHVMGTYADVAHGHTSCVLLPAVLAWQRGTLGDAEQLVRGAIDARAPTAAEAVSSLVRDLGLPSRLRDIGVQGDQLSEIARRSVDDPLMAHARRIPTARDVEAILQAAW